MEERVTLFTSPLDAPLIVFHRVIGGMPGTSTLDAIHNPKCHLEHVAPLDRYDTITYILLILNMFIKQQRGPRCWLAHPAHSAAHDSGSGLEVR